MRAEIDRERAASYGIDPRAVADAIEQAMRGTEATQFADFDRRVPVVVRLPDTQRQDLATLEAIRVNGIPISQMVTLHPGLGPAEIHRVDQARVVPIFADVARGGLDGAVRATEAALVDSPPPPGLIVDIGGGNEEMRRSFRDLAFAFGLAVLLVYMILAAQFESFVQPFTVLLSVPLGLVGALLGLAATGSGINTMSLIGIVILIGIADNDAIIKVDMILRLRRDGLPRREAILKAGQARLRPIVITTATTVLGLAPMALGLGSGADLRAPLAIALIGGLIVATALTLIVIPVAFDLVEEARGRWFGAGAPGEIGASPVVPVGVLPPRRKETTVG
jgi:HAE1 family hydrophobic/amphiphilic exporter-1